MSDPPKPLPRTRIRSLPVRVIQNRSDDNLDLGVNNSEIEAVKNCYSQVEHLETTNKLEASQSTIVGNNQLHEYVEIPLDDINLTDKIGTNHENKENIPEKESDENQLSSAEVETVEETKKNNDIDQYDADDDDDVIDEILKYKTNTQEKKLFENDNVSVTNTKSEDSRTSCIKSGESGKIASSKVEEEKDSESLIDGNNENLLGIHIHRSDCLKIYRLIRHPSVIIHIINAENNGTYLEKSKPNKNVTYNQEISSFILPVMTKPFNFKDNKSIIPEWEETVTFNETTSHVIKSSTIIFFEIVDFIDSLNSDTDYASVGWHRIAWAFLKPFMSNNTLIFDKVLRLQLYYADAKSSSISNTSNIPCVYKLFRSKRWKTYPSTLYVTVKNISLHKIDTKPQQRSCTPFQPEIGSDASVKSLAMFSSDGEDSSDLKDSSNMSAHYRLSNIEWNRFPGQSCRIPNVKISTLHPDPKGSLAVKFSNSGILLACGTCNDVFIYAIDGILERRLTSHQGLIYTLCWFSDDSLLLSASADCTACIWDMKSSSENPLQILPHPSFVYCSTFVFPENAIVTGCYDGMVRIWWQTHACSRFWQLQQELTGHEQYVNTLCSFRNKEFFSGDSVGVIIRWTVDEYGRWFKLNVIKLSEIHGIIINKLSAFPGNKRLLIHTRDSLLRTMDIKTSVIIQWYQGGLNDSSQCSSTITPCGSYIYSISEDGTANVWESNTGKHVAFYSPGTLINGCGGTIDFHPFDHILALSFYSAGYTCSAVNLLKYSNNATGSSDVMLYLLNEHGFPPIGRDSF